MQLCISERVMPVFSGLLKINGHPKAALDNKDETDLTEADAAPQVPDLLSVAGRREKSVHSQGNPSSGVHWAVRPFLTRWVRLPVIQSVRAYIRYCPVRFGKGFIWSCASPIVRGGWIDHVFVARTVFGAEIPVNAADFMDRSIYYLGVWEPNVVAFISRRLARGDVFVDVGANIGHHTLLASTLVGDGTVVAVEASPKIFQMLEANLARNDARNVCAINMAVSSKAGTMRMYKGEPGNRSTASVLPGGEFECEVQALPLDDILTPDEVRHARIIKIDVEGAESMVLAGMRRILKEGRPDLEVMVELAPDRLANLHSSVDHVLAEFRSHGFFPFRLENDYELTHNFQPSRAVRPARLDGSFASQVDVIFSRVDAAVL
jgi:FkbM family methyltransferase